MPADRFLHPKAGHSNKVTRLSHFEYRVWTQYLLSADDFGVMRATAVKLQADNDALAHAKPSIVQAAIERLISCGLLRVFEHQGRRFVFQHDWQKWQRVEWPRATNEPRPPADAIAACEELTQALFEKHPGGQRRLRGGSGAGGGVQASTPVHAPVHVPTDSGDVQESTPTTRARGRAERLWLTATAEANGSGERPTPPLDEWFRDLASAYPEQRVTTGFLAQSAFCDAITDDGRDPRVVFDEMLDNLDNQKAGYEWRVLRKIPNLDKWLREGRWKQRHDATPPTALVSERTLQNEISGDAFVKGGRHGTH